jgi:hypothetical protein
LIIELFAITGYSRRLQCLSGTARRVKNIAQAKIIDGRGKSGVDEQIDDLLLGIAWRESKGGS